MKGMNCLFVQCCGGSNKLLTHLLHKILGFLCALSVKLSWGCLFCGEQEEDLQKVQQQSS